MKKDKFFLRILAIASFLAAIYFIIFSCRKFSLEYPICRGLLSSIIILFNVIIMLGWSAFGEIGLWLFISLSSIAVFIVSVGSEIPWLKFQIPIFFVIGFFVTAFKNRMISYGLSIHRQIENLEEELNALKAEYAITKSTNEALKEKVIRYATLKDLTGRLSSSLDLDSVINVAIDNVFELVEKQDACLLFLVEEEEQELALKAARGKSGQISIKSKKGDIFDLWVLKQRQPLLMSDVGKDFRFNLDLIPEEFKREYKSLISAPIIFEKKVIGVLRVESKRADTYVSDDLRFLAILADLVAIALENAKLYHRIEELAIRDGLTGLYCHRYFKDRLDEDIIKATRIRQPLSVLMLDIDNFKEYNDKYGHIAGDIVLKHIADILKSSTEPGDFVARYGGEEFVLILFDRDKAEAQKFAEALRRKIESEIILLRRTETRITVSIGCATFPRDSIVKDELIKLADGALYEAKKRGKNRVCLA